MDRSFSAASVVCYTKWFCSYNYFRYFRSYSPKHYCYW